MEAQQNDVLSGRGACFNFHPGNKRFRSILVAQMAAYTAGTKKQKMMISKSIVDTIYSMEPPGRFMKKCTDTGLWVVLSQREAVDKTAQAMAYVVRTSRNATKKHSSLPLVSTASQPNPRPIPPSYANTGLEDSASSPTARPHVPGVRASALVRRWDTNADLMGRHHARDSSHQQ
mmetsp:Transcript_20389/g.28662  ORF Transcript_20389/g.28662 Transcript_20389/m.28662 type:complete len:175 (-) Transcript_20389:499-1023(-)